VNLHHVQSYALPPNRKTETLLERWGLHAAVLTADMPYAQSLNPGKVDEAKVIFEGIVLIKAEKGGG